MGFVCFHGMSRTVGGICVVPGTSERICLIVGPIHAVRKVQIFMMEKIRDKPDPSMTPDDAKNQHDRHRQVIEVFAHSHRSSVVVVVTLLHVLVEDLAFRFTLWMVKSLHIFPSPTIITAQRYLSHPVPLGNAKSCILPLM